MAPSPALGFRWLHDSFGSNYRMTELQAALGIRQLDRLAETNAIRTTNAEIMLEAVERLPGLRTPRLPPDLRHAWYRFYTFVRPERLGPDWTRDRILTDLNARGVSCFAGSCSEIRSPPSLVKPASLFS